MAAASPALAAALKPPPTHDAKLDAALLRFSEVEGNAEALVQALRAYRRVWKQRASVSSLSRRNDGATLMRSRMRDARRSCSLRSPAESVRMSASTFIARNVLSSRSPRGDLSAARDGAMPLDGMTINDDPTPH